MSKSKVTDYATALETLEKIHACLGNIHYSVCEYIDDPEYFMDNLYNHSNNYNDFMNAGYYLGLFREWFCDLEDDLIQ